MYIYEQDQFITFISLKEHNAPPKPKCSAFCSFLLMKHMHEVNIRKIDNAYIFTEGSVITVRQQ